MLKEMKIEKLKKEGSVDHNRRKFLTVMLVGSGGLLTAKVLGPLYSWFFSDSSAENPARAGSLKTDSLNEIDIDSGSFRIVRNNEGLSIYNATGEEIFQIDNKR